MLKISQYNYIWYKLNISSNWQPWL